MRSKFAILVALLGSTIFSTPLLAQSSGNQIIGVPLFQGGARTAVQGISAAGEGDNLGNHYATMPLDMGGNALNMSGGQINTSGGMVNLDGGRIINMADPLDPTDGVNLQFLNDSIGASQRTYPVAPANPIWTNSRTVDVSAHGDPTVTDVNQVAIGMNARVSDDNPSGPNYGGGLAIGSNSRSHGLNSIALGAFSQAGAIDVNGAPITRSMFGIAVGVRSVSTGNEAISIGRNTLASGVQSVAIGASSQATVDKTVSVGSDSLKRRIMHLANGVDPSDAVTLAQLNAATGTGSTYSAGSGIAISASNVISVDSTVIRTTGAQSITGIKTFATNPRSLVDPVVGDDLVRLSYVNGLINSLRYTAGSGIDISASNVIAADSTVVRTSGDQDIAGLKNFTSSQISITSSANRHVWFRATDGMNRGLVYHDNANSTMNVRNYGADGTSVTGELSVRPDGRIMPNVGRFDGNNRVISTVADPVSPQDAVNLRTLQAAIGSGGGGGVYTGGSGITINASNLVSVDSSVVRTTGDQTIADIKTFTSPIRVVNSFNINGNNPNQQQNGLYVADLGTVRGTTFNPLLTAAILGQVSAARSIGVSVDAEGYLYGYRTSTGYGNYTWKSRVRDAEKLQTPRTINGVPFDGTANITIPLGSGLPNDIVYHSRTISTGTGINGGGNLSANRSLSLNEDWHRRWAGANIAGLLGYNGFARTNGQLYGGNTNPVNDTRLNYDGNFYATRMWSTGYFQFSDEKLKDDVVTIDPNRGMEMIKDLRPVSFTWKQDGKEALGFIAQEVRETIPTAVFENDGGDLAVDYAQTIAPLIAAVQQMEMRIADLEAELEEARNP